MVFWLFPFSPVTPSNKEEEAGGGGGERSRGRSSPLLSSLFAFSEHICRPRSRRVTLAAGCDLGLSGDGGPCFGLRWLRPDWANKSSNTGDGGAQASSSGPTILFTMMPFLLSQLQGRVAASLLSRLATLLEFSVRSYLVGNAGSRPISEAKQPWACLVLRWGTTGEAHVLYSPSFLLFSRESRIVGCL